MNPLCFFFVLVAGFPPASRPAGPQLHDRDALLAIKRELGITGWGDSNLTDFCSWPGIRCGSNQSRVEELDLSHRNLRGNVTPIADLANLKWLDLSYNFIEQPIPPSFGNLSQLEFLDLSSNKFTGSIPAELGRLRNLRALNLSSNLLVGEIPDSLRDLESLGSMQISVNKLSGRIPLWVGNLTNLRVLMAYENYLEGEIPANLGSASRFGILNLHSNLLEGSIPGSVFASGTLESLVLTNNRLSGNLPEEIGNCSGLSSIRIGNNDFAGFVPKTIGNIRSLTYFEADSNHFSGEVVSEFALCLNITLLNLASNLLSGMIPSSLGQLANLQELILTDNSLYGEIPKSILRCRNLNKLDLSYNKLSGAIPREICSVSRLQYLLLADNSIRGEIPRELGNCAKLLELQMGSNYLTGTIPPEIGRIRNLQISLNLSFNHLHGALPPELGKLDQLVSVDVSNNQLSGNIPPELRGMLSLIEINFSNNLLTGPVPAFIPFQKSPNSSFFGNKGLCGDPLSSPCEAPDGGGGGGDYHHRVSYKIILTVIGSGLAVFVTVSIVVLLFMAREKQERVASRAAGADAEAAAKIQSVAVTGNVFVESLKQAVDFDAVVKATMKESNKVSSGTFSSVYQAAMPSGMLVAARRLNSMDRTLIHHRSKMIREVERLSRLCHDNLMSPIGFVIYEDAAILLHHHPCNGTLAQFLRDPARETSPEVEWPTRLSIAIGAAQGLAFLHHVAIIHLDISAGNVLLDAGFKPLLGETEISKLLDPSKGTASISAVAGSFGYIPPEYAYTMQVTAPGNVYSYGVILLEILTRRAPVEEEFGEGTDLVKWVHGAPGRGETPEQILDARLSTVSFGWRREMLAALKVALLCTDLTPAKRPKMKTVVEMLQEIRQG